LWLPHDARLPEGHVVLSFDDGPDPRATPRVRAVLTACGIRAHFFVPGSRLVGVGGAWAREEVLGLAADGHVVGTHSFSHPSFSRRLLFRKQRRKEVARGLAALERVLEPPIPLFRLPYGDGHEESAVHLAVWDEGVVNMHWNLSSGDTRDADRGQPGFQGAPPERLLKWILRSLDRSRRPGERLGHGVLTMHDTNYRTALMLPHLVAHLIAEGYTFVRLVGPAIARYGDDGPSPAPARPIDDGDAPADDRTEVEETP
jgi:peptidoglycan/xylan/chitin deacetylase (PgdA/CDA1 family)